jgi:phosphohistidine phosphatase
MLRLMLLRHSKAVPLTGGNDHQRALTERGREDAARLGQLLAAEKFEPDAAIHSGARRTRETLAIVLAQFRSAVKESAEPKLYNASYGAFLHVARSCPDPARTVLLVGHNPTIGEVACRLSGDGDAHALAQMAAKFPTSALAVVDFQVDHWLSVGEGQGRLIRFATPASLGGTDA